MGYNEKEALEILDYLGNECFEKRDYVRAILYYEKYININQSSPSVYNTLGYLYQMLSKYENIETQIEFHEKALSLDSNYICALRNLALAYPLVGRNDEAIKCFHKLFDLGPVLDDYVAYAYLQIMLKNFEEGFKYYEYRFIRDNCIDYPEMDKPKWEGQEILDKTLLVHYEQGYGDSIQFFRYLERVKPLAKKIIFRVQDSLVGLIKNSIEGIDVVGTEDSLDRLSFDYHIPLISLLHYTKATVSDIPLSKGYIEPDKNKVARYKKDFFDNDCFKIGISWNGTKFGNRRRNIPLECFLPLEKLKNVKIYSFQKGFGAEQMQELSTETEVVDLGRTFEDFSDTAAAMENLDLFVTSDNCLFNLAGAMGKKTFVLLSKYSEWRWFLDEEKTPWYDSVKIFKKQNEIDDWDMLIPNIIESIEHELKNKEAKL